jgi:Mrp family chromosome partitioning ATPase/capsular polysaccharide biosynthesis protein
MNETSDFATLLAPLWRRKWLILAVAVVAAAGTYFYYHRQTSVYSAGTQLDLSGGFEAQQLATGAQTRSTLNNRALADAATLITSSGIREAVQARLRREHAPATHLGNVRARGAAESDLVTIVAEAHSAKQAARLANDYALAYVEKQHLRHQSEVQAAIADTRRQLRRIEAAQAASVSAARHASSGRGSGAARVSPAAGSAVIQAAGLASKINQLESELSVSSVQQINPASAQKAQLVSPMPRKNAIFAFVLGLLAAGAAVLGLNRLDRRVRSLAQLQDIFGSQILAALPRERAPIDYRDGRPRPAEALLEPLRRLHTAIQLGDMLERAEASPPRLILFLSPGNGDGRSTLIADLALVQRDAGAQVAVIEADLRRPSLARLLSIGGSAGLSEVLSGAARSSQALQGVGATLSSREEDLSGEQTGLATAVRARDAGSLSVLASGGPVANPPALLASPAMRELVRDTTADYDYVLIDAPPPLQVSDAMPLLQWVDGIVIVSRMDHTSAASAEHLARLLANSSTAPVIGLVASGVSRAQMRRGGFGSGYGEARRRRIG